MNDLHLELHYNESSYSWVFSAPPSHFNSLSEPFMIIMLTLNRKQMDLGWVLGSHGDEYECVFRDVGLYSLVEIDLRFRAMVIFVAYF
jgi:hypothetical protein